MRGVKFQVSYMILSFIQGKKTKFDKAIVFSGQRFEEAKLFWKLCETLIDNQNIKIYFTIILNFCILFYLFYVQYWY